MEWVLGSSRAASAPFVVTEIDSETGAMLATNRWSTEFGSRVAFADLAGRQVAWTGDRTEFLGRDGTLDHPAALRAERRSPIGSARGLDPAALCRPALELGPNAAWRSSSFSARRRPEAEAVALVTRYRTPISTRYWAR